MGHSQYDDASRERAAWNAGKEVETKRPLTQADLGRSLSSIARDAFATVPYSISQSTASFAAATWSRSEEYGTHSLRRTKASMIYKATGNLRAIQILLGHSKIENTVPWCRRRGRTAFGRTN